MCLCRRTRKALITFNYHLNRFNLREREKGTTRAGNTYNGKQQQHQAARQASFIEANNVICTRSPPHSAQTLNHRLQTGVIVAEGNDIPPLPRFFVHTIQTMSPHVSTPPHRTTVYRGGIRSKFIYNEKKL